MSTLVTALRKHHQCAFKTSQTRVIARSIVFRYKGRELDPLQARDELAVRAILTGASDKPMTV